MSENKNHTTEALSEAQCLHLVSFVSEKLTQESAETAVQQIIEYMKELFSLPCVSVREIIPRPYSLRYTYETLDDETKKKRINETVTFDKQTWERSMKLYEKGHFLYLAEKDMGEVSEIGPLPNPPTSVLIIPMFCSGDFLGTVDFVRFDDVREWSELEIKALKICCEMICQRLYSVNTCFTAKRAENKYDPITGLMSSELFTRRSDEMLPELLKKSPVAITYTDIHRFKYINETYGYKKGDELLKLTAAALLNKRSENGEEFMICRVHSDNFVSVIPVPEENVSSYADYVHSRNMEICEILRESCPDVQIRINTGICFVTTVGTDANTAIANANLARKLAKSEGLRRPLVFTESMMDDIKYQEYLNNELPKAIANHWLTVYYQPKINCADDALYGAEALIRWKQPDGSFIYPDKFIPVFEKNGNIIEVDFYVYREVFSYLRRRLDAGLPVVPISMNVSRIHFNYDRIIPYIKSLIDEYKIPSYLLEFELTENIYIKNYSKANEFIKTCRGMGIKVSMDDFGSGYSSLNMMSTLEIDTLKIDKVFLKNETLNESDKTVLESMISMAKRLGMRVLCEGVETSAQSKFLKKVHCDIIQGYYYGKPMDEKSFDEFTENKMR